MTEKISKDEARYRPGFDETRCANCTMFVAPNSCTLVAGTIATDGLCDHFEKAPQ